MSGNTPQPVLQTPSDQKRTLVILDNYKSNIMIVGDVVQDVNVKETSKPIEIKQKCKEVDESPDSSPRCKSSIEPVKATKEELISKLLEDSLRKARENGEVLDESSGEAILKILKQSLLKSSESSSGVEQEPGYFTPSSDGDLIATSMFIEENTYEVIKEPIYEEIPDEPPPLPLSPPPSEEFLKGRSIFFGDEYRGKGLICNFIIFCVKTNIRTLTNCCRSE